MSIHRDHDAPFQTDHPENLSWLQQGNSPQLGQPGHHPINGFAAAFCPGMAQGVGAALGLLQLGLCSSLYCVLEGAVEKGKSVRLLQTHLIHSKQIKGTHQFFNLVLAWPFCLAKWLYSASPICHSCMLLDESRTPQLPSCALSLQSPQAEADLQGELGCWILGEAEKLYVISV